MFNKVVLLGNLTRDIDIRFSADDTAIASTGLAVNRRYTKKSGEKVDETCFIDIVFYSNQAKTANQYLRKGSKVLIEGRLKLESWTDQNGQKRSKHSVQVENMQMLSGKDEDLSVQMRETNERVQDFKPKAEPKKLEHSYQNQEKTIDVDAYEDDTDLPF